MANKPKPLFSIWPYVLALAVLYLTSQYITKHYGPGWALISLLSLVFVGAVLEERKI